MRNNARSKSDLMTKKIRRPLVSAGATVLAVLFSMLLKRRSTNYESLQPRYRLFLRHPSPMRVR